MEPAELKRCCVECRTNLISLFNLYTKQQCYPWLRRLVRSRRDEGNKNVQYPDANNFVFEHIKVNWEELKKSVTQGLVLTPEQKDHITPGFVIRQPWAWTILLGCALYRESLTPEQQSQPRFNEVSVFLVEMYIEMDKEDYLNVTRWSSLVLQSALGSIFQDPTPKVAKSLVAKAKPPHVVLRDPQHFPTKFYTE